VSCAKTAEWIEMQFGIWFQWLQGTRITWGCRCSHEKGHFWGVWPIEYLNDLYAVWWVFVEGVAFWGWWLHLC